MAALGDGGPLTSGPHDVGGMCKGDPDLGALPHNGKFDLQSFSALSHSLWLYAALIGTGAGEDPDAIFIANAKRSFAQWERETVAMIYMVRKQDWTDGERVLSSWDQVRRAIESLPKSVYDSTAYLLRPPTILTVLAFFYVAPAAVPVI